MTQARLRLRPDMAMLPREKWDELIYCSNLGREGSKIADLYFIQQIPQIDIADLYFIQQIPQIDIAEEIGLDRKTVGKRITTARTKLEYNYERFFKS